MTRFLTYGDKGERVERLQRLLNENRFHNFRRKLRVDGEMGPLTCGAVKNLKYWMGYQRDDMDPDVVDQIAGGFLFDLLAGRRPLPPAYRARRKRRIEKAREAAKRRPLRLKILAVAEGDVGTLEGPNNDIKYNDWWCGRRRNDGGAYCVSVRHVLGADEAGCLPSARLSWENTDALLADAKAGRNGVHITHDPDAGHRLRHRLGRPRRPRSLRRLRRGRRGRRVQVAGGQRDAGERQAGRRLPLPACLAVLVHRVRGLTHYRKRDVMRLHPTSTAP